MASARLDALAAHLGARLKAAGATLATAESCTGGWIAQAVTSVAGSSDWFERGYVTYSNRAKIELLGVSGDTLEQYGAVSEETAREMALGALRGARVALAVAVTGVAGPSGGTLAKPVGMVCFAWAGPGRLLASETRRFRGGRAAVRRRSVERALEGIVERLDAARGRA